MGNTSSDTIGASASESPKKGNNLFQSLLKPSNALGLSKAELDERCRPSGLYDSCEWEEKAIRRLIGDGKIAARLKGTEDRIDCKDRECPICFFNYSEINVTKCCQANICTECYLQVRPQKSGTKNKAGKSNHNCPFCNASKLHVTVAGKLDDCAIEKRFQEEQALEAAKIRARGSSTPPPPDHQEQPEASPATPTSGFGSSLAQNERVAMMRMRSSSLSERSESVTKSPVQEISSLAMTPEERRSLEQEMRAQHHHPLTMRLEAEEAERRMRNQMEYYRRNNTSSAGAQPYGGASTSSLLGRPSSASSQHYRSSSYSAGLQLPQSTPREGRDWNRIVDAFESRGSGVGNVQSLDDLVVLEAAIMLSMEEEARRRGEPPPTSRNAASAANFDAERHASANFPLARARVSENNNNNRFPSLASGSNILSGRANASGRLSEEQQIALAIQASLQQSEQQQQGDGSRPSSLPPSR